MMESILYSAALLLVTVLSEVLLYAAETHVGRGANEQFKQQGGQRMLEEN